MPIPASDNRPIGERGGPGLHFSGIPIAQLPVDCFQKLVHAHCKGNFRQDPFSFTVSPALIARNSLGYNLLSVNGSH